MDEEAARLEREEKRRIRRERIKRILDDDSHSTVPARRSKQDVNGIDATRSERSSAATRRARDTTSYSRSRSREELDHPPARSGRSRLSRGDSTDGDEARSSSPSSLKARREARRLRNQEHDSVQNKLENGTADKGDLSRETRGDRGEYVSRYKRDRMKEDKEESSEISSGKSGRTRRYGRETETEKQEGAVKGDFERMKGITETENVQKSAMEPEVDVNEMTEKGTKVNGMETVAGDVMVPNMKNIEEVEEKGMKVNGIEMITGEDFMVTDTNSELDVEKEEERGKEVDGMGMIGRGDEIEEKNKDVDTGEVKKKDDVRVEDKEMEVDGKGETEMNGGKMEDMIVTEDQGNKLSAEVDVGIGNDKEESKVLDNNDGGGLDVTDGSADADLKKDLSNRTEEKSSGKSTTETTKLLESQEIHESFEQVTADEKVAMVRGKDDNDGVEPSEIDGLETMTKSASVNEEEPADSLTSTEKGKSKSTARQGKELTNLKSEEQSSQVAERSQESPAEVVSSMPKDETKQDTSKKGDPSESVERKTRQTEALAKKKTEPALRTKAAGKLKVDGDSWQKSTRKKRGDFNREVELRVLNKTGKLKNKLQSCKQRDVETSEPWKKEVKKNAKKHHSLDEDAQKELQELSRRRELKERVQTCNELDQESAEAWTPKVKKGAKKHRSLDAEAEAELKELGRTQALKARIKGCEEKDKESVEAWTREVKPGGELPKVPELSSEEIGEFAAGGRLKDLIASCAERDEKRDESWKSAKTKAKTGEEEAELKELNLKEAKSKIIQSFEEKDKESAEAKAGKLKPGEGPKSLDELTNEELKELSKTVDVKERIKMKLEDKEPEIVPKVVDLTEEDELKEINLKSRIEAYKQESEKVGMSKDNNDKPEGFVPIKEDIKEPEGTVQDSSGGMASPKRDTGGTKSPVRKDKISRTSPNKGDNVGRISQSKGDSGGRASPTKRDTGGRQSPGIKLAGKTSPVKDISGRSESPGSKLEGNNGSPVKDAEGRGRISPVKKDTKGRSSPAKDLTPGKSKLDSIRANLMVGGKGKKKSTRESLKQVSKSVSIKDKIAACKQRDDVAPARKIPVDKTPSKPRQNATAGQVGSAGLDAGEQPELIPVNRAPPEESENDAEQNEVAEVDIKNRMSYWESPKTDGDDTTAAEDDTGAAERRPMPIILGPEKHAWVSRKRKLSAVDFIKALTLGAKCRKRELTDIHDVQSETTKYLAAKKGEEKVRGSVSEEPGDEMSDEEPREVEKARKKSAGRKVDRLNVENLARSDVRPHSANLEDFSFDDVVNPNEIKQLSGFSDFRRQVRPTNRRAAKSNPVRKLQQRKDVKSEADMFNELDLNELELEEQEVLKPTAIGRLGKPIEPGDRKSKEITFSKDALAGLSAKEDVSKISLKKTAKSRKGVSQEKSRHDGTAPVMLLQIKGHRHLQTRLVEPSADSFNSADSFMCITEKHMYVWHGRESNVMKKSKAAELANRIIQYKLMNCNANTVTVIKDTGTNTQTGLRKQFWEMLGGRKPIKSAKETPEDGVYEKAVVSSNSVFMVDSSSEPAKLEKMPELCGKIPSIKMLDSNKAFVFDFGSEVYAWLGRTCDTVARSNALKLGQELFKGKFHTTSSLNPITPNNTADTKGSPQDLTRPPWAVFGRMPERAENILFEEKFLDWPDPKTKVKLDEQKDLLNKNLSGGYQKRKAKMQEKEVQIIELVAFDGAEMAKKPPPVEMILEGVNVGRGRGSYDEVERRSLIVTTNSVTVYHSSEKEYRQLEEKEWGHFYTAESYVIRWSYSVKASGIRSLKGGESKHDTQSKGRDQIAYYFWHGRDCSASGKGTSALATIELDSDKSPQIMVDQGDETACFLNMFDGQMTVHHGKLNDKAAIEEDNVLMYCVQHEDERETSFVQIEARASNLRSRSSFIVVIVEKSIGICVWHGAKSTKEKKDGAVRAAKRLALWFQGLFELKKCDIVEVDEGQEEDMFWKALGGKCEYGSLLKVGRKVDYQPRLFYFTSAEGPFIAKEILNPTRGDVVSPYPFKQSQLYSASQPALFLLDAVHTMYLWQGWWPNNPEESDSATTTGSAEFRWHRDRRLAMQTTQSYADIVGRQMSKSYVINAGLEPLEFRAMFPYWEDDPDVTQTNLENGKIDGKRASMIDHLARLSRNRYSLAELQVRPLPEGVDPSKMEMYLSDQEFKEVFKVSKDDFIKLPRWKKLEQRKSTGLF